ncbi:MAG: xanthine dehydrogenase family protein molybdopterin-binding subunit [Deltaproteobacteria bacterium]|nr:xanthine dehydrogenase family protein molybdopterin-binding subunit [Deltaproteobacteria bacterium]
MELKVVGRPLGRIEGPEKVGGKTLYAADVQLPGLVWGKCLRSPIPHGKILRVDASKAKKLKGVLAVLTGEDLPPVRVGLRLQDMPLLARGKVRFAGDKVAAVVAEELDTAEEALSLIQIDYEDLPSVSDPMKAMEPGAPIIHEELASYKELPHPPVEKPNVFSSQKWSSGDLNKGFAEADLILEHTFRTHLAHQGYIEPHACVVAVDSGDHVQVWASCKAPFRVKELLAEQLGLPKEHIRVNVITVGGDFGGKGSLMDVPLCYFLAKAVGRPVKMVMSYAEELMAGDPRHPSVVRLKTGVERDGRLIAREADIVFNSGAYAAFKPAEVVNLGGASYATGVYRIPNFTIHAYGVYTNSVPCGYMRAPGQPQVIFAVESHMDLIAKELKIDPLELRLKNLFSDGELLPSKRPLERVRCREVLEAAAKKAGWGRPKPGKNVGHGIAVSFRHVGGSGETNLEMSVTPAGKIHILSTVPDTGTGTHTLLRQIAAEVLTIPPEDIGVAIGDTETFEADAAPGGSKITFMSGRAVLATAEEMREKMKVVAARLMGCNPDQVKLEKGCFFGPRGEKNKVSFAAVAREVAHSGNGLHIRKTYRPKGRSGVAGFFAQVAEVEVDQETGILKVRRIVTAHDVGTIINPLTHQGQIEGGVIQAFGYATMEEVGIEDGKVVTLNLGDYRIPCTQDLPLLDTVLVEDAAGPGPFAAKQIGENSIVATAAAIANALHDAVGVRIFDLPLTAEKIYFALRSSKSAA